jgi:hypothetical protein
VGVDAKYRNIMWQVLPGEDFHEHQRDILNLFVYLPPKSIDYKRDMGAKIQAAVAVEGNRVKAAATVP